MKVFDKTASHPLVSLLEERMEQADYALTQAEIFQKLPKDFHVNIEAIFPGEDYIEWIDLVEAVSSARDRFVMFEIGAGYGKWSINALKALQFLNPIPFHFVAVEAEKDHFRFLKEYFAAHHLDLTEHRLIEAAIDVKKGHAVFHMGDPNEWYGQNIDGEKVTLLNRIIYAIQSRYLKTKRRKAIVPTITLNSILEEYERVDLIDMDIQGAELLVLKASIDLLNKKVKRLHIGTHSNEIDAGLEDLFHQHRWKNVHLYPAFSTCLTEYGTISFNDGIQSWVNPQIE